MKRIKAGSGRAWGSPKRIWPGWVQGKRGLVHPWAEDKVIKARREAIALLRVVTTAALVVQGAAAVRTAAVVPEALEGEVAPAAEAAVQTVADLVEAVAPEAGLEEDLAEVVVLAVADAELCSS